MIKKRIQEESPKVEPFHIQFPYALEWFIKKDTKKLQHNAYFPYDDYRERYAKRLKSDKTVVGIRKYATEPRTN